MVGSGSMLRSDEQNFELVVQVAPTILSLEPRALTVVQSEQAVFTCNATARPRPTITWFRMNTDGSLTDVTDRDNVTVTPMNIGEREVYSELVISDAQPSDAGDYFCQADNIVASVDETFNLTVHVEPIITFPTDGFTFTVNEMETAVFECTATGIPPPTISWFRNGMELSEGQPITLTNRTAPMLVPGDGGMVYSVSRMLMLAETRDDDSDTYTCTASNAVGSDDQGFELVVQVAPDITRAPMNVTTVQPDSTEFICNATGRPTPMISWFFNGISTALANGLGVSIMDTSAGRDITSTLSLSDTFPSDAGEYVCVADNIVDTAQASAVLTVHVIPVIVFPLEEDTFTYIANVTESVTFQCSATGIPPPSIQWFRNGTLLDGSDTSGLNSRVDLSDPTQGLFTVEGGDVYFVERTITVDPVQVEDNGTFTCSAMNVAGNDDEDFELFVQVPPLVVPEVQTISTNETNTETLNFRVENARPAVVEEDVTWYFSRNFSDSPFTGAVDITGQPENAPGSTLTFSAFENNGISLTIGNIVQGRREADPTDAGRYFLVAVNAAGLDFSFIDLVVHGMPTIRAPPQDHVTIDGQNAMFICSALASPRHNIFWEFTADNGSTTNIINTEEMSNSTKYSIDLNRADTQRFGELTVNSVQFEDRGTYRCFAENDLGSVNASANLTVHVTPVIRQTSNSTAVRLEDMEEVNFICLTTGYPLPDITWQKDGEEVNTTELNEESNGGRVEILSSQVVDGFGNGMSAAVGGVESGDILALGDLGVVSVLRFTSVVRGDTANYTCNATNFLLETGVLSNPISLTVLERPDRPEIVTVIDFTARTVTLQWIPGFDGNRPVMNFRIYQQNQTFTNNANFSLILTLDPSELTTANNFLSVIISDTILPFRSFSFIVVACNEIGCSEQSDATGVVLTLQDRPDAPPMIEQSFSPNSTSLFYSWSPPPEEQQNGIIAGYRVRYTAPETDETIESITETNINLTSLESFTLYTVEISAGTFVGFGPPAVDTERTLPGTPSGSLTAFFQLRLRPVGDCVPWTQIDRDGKFTAIISEISRIVAETCFCSFTSANIIANAFSCRTSTDDVVFKAELMYAGLVNADELVQLISQWANGRPSILYEGTLLSVDPTCPTELESLFAEDCFVPSQQPTTAIAAGVVLGIVGVLLTAIIVVLVTIFVLRRRRSQSHQFSPASQVAVYEDVSGIELKPAEPVIFQNAAYGHFKHPAAAAARGPPPAVPTAGESAQDEDDHTYDYI